MTSHGDRLLQAEPDAVWAVPAVVRRPALDRRNTETLRRLSYLAERRPSTTRVRGVR